MAVARMPLIIIVALGAFRLGDIDAAGFGYLLAFYGFGFCSAFWYVIATWRARRPAALLTWAQLLVDLGVVAATVSFTGGPTSFFTFLFVIVILEAGLLLGPAQGFIFASFAVAVMLVQFMMVAPSTDSAYNFLVQALAFFLSASMSGYWNRQVRQMQQFQREILDNLNNGFLITDQNGMITAQNKSGDAILMIPEGSALGLPVQDFLRVEPEGECPVLTALRSQRDFTRYEFHARVGNGHRKLFGLSTSLIHDWRGEVTGVIVSFSDLTEMESMRQELQRQDRLAIVGELAAGLAHEIRNPVAAIRGAVDELQNAANEPAVAQKLSAIALRESDHLNRIVSDFLDFARNPELNRELFDVRDLVKEVVENLQREGGEAHGFTVDVQSPGNECLVSGDKTQIRQVFVNLCRNAVESMGGRETPNGRLAVQVTLGAGHVEIRFDDEGPGIDPDVVARIFEPFYTTKDKGVGMGLAVCQRIITAHDGIIRAVSRESGGTSMRVQLPSAQTGE
jgi:two-component system sensor histidine kinase PilS (NtrC family)